MVSRRQSLKNFVGFAALTGAAVTSAQAQESCAVFTKDSQTAMTPDAALKRLQDGNARFVAGKTVNCDLVKQVRETANQQSPIAVIVGCIDSRVPPELVFDQRLGDIFAARVAGNFVNTDILGSLEFATKLVGSKLVVVLGHTECGAIKGAVDDAKLGNLTAMLANIRPSMSKLKYSGVPSSKNKELVQQLADQNAKDAADMVLRKSPVIAELVRDGKVKIVSAMHDVATGKITWFA
ncbi:MAG: carbonic anhydrase [Polaromonas sp.]|uniref:carbonic anhydrase family protein n=1 Tax=Polaromonas sp. TaxID=1869339 RepID=UPI0025DFD396|nr:carbonic anhydrase family protein [Polaromonas sp.]MBI2726071.1 carbonic anhydrase [Polaromonas sp.]